MNGPLHPAIPAAINSLAKPEQPPASLVTWKIVALDAKGAVCVAVAADVPLKSDQELGEE